MTDLAKLNRLRVNSGKPELKRWAASKDKLIEAITALETAGFTDALPGAKTDAQPVIEDPELAKARPEPEKPKEPEAEEPPKEEKPEPEVKKQKPQLAKGLETESMARQSRIAVAMQRDREKKEEKERRETEKAEKKADKKAKKNKAPKEEKLPKGAVDPKKDPEKAARQKKHIEDKKKAREAKGDKKPAKETNANEITVADIARELSIDPKVARAKLRRHEDKINKLHTKGQDRWTFPKTAKAELVKILK